MTTALVLVCSYPINSQSQWDARSLLWYQLLEMCFPHSDMSVHSIQCQEIARYTIPTLFHAAQMLQHHCNVIYISRNCFPHLHLPIHSIPWQNHARNPISTDFYPRKTLPSVRNQYQGLSEMDNITAMWYPFVEMNFPHSHLSIHSIPWQNHARNPISTDYVPDNTTQWQKSIPRVFSIWITSLQCDIPF